MSADPGRRPTEYVLTSATVIVMNKNDSASSGQGMLAISPNGCFYFEGGDHIVRATSLDELEKHFAFFKSTTDDQKEIVALIMSTIATHKNGNRTS